MDAHIARRLEEAAARVPQWAPRELHARLGGAQPPVVVDVREPYEHDRGVIAGALLLPLGLLEQDASGLPRDREIVVVCEHGIRSLLGAQVLLQRGWPRVASLEGGCEAWRFAGLSLQRPERPR
jgi:rhodanese-related sulfurtransferase